MATIDDPMDDDRIVALVTHEINMAAGMGDSRLSKEREKTLRYYRGKLPGPQFRGDVSYTSRDVYDGVTSMKAQLLEVFSGNRRPVNFVQSANEADLQARARTDRVTQIVFSENPGYQIFQTVIDDALMYRNGVCKVWWDESYKTEEYELTEPAEADLQKFFEKDPTAKITALDHKPDGSSLQRVRLEVKRDRSQVCIRPLPAEEFVISAMASDIKTATLVAHRQPKTISDLLKMGYDRATVMALNDDARVWLELGTERQERFSETDDLIGFDDGTGQTATRTCTLIEAYMELDIDGSGETQLYKIDMVGTNLLDKQPVSSKPFIDFCALPDPHSFWGENFADLLTPIQIANTYMKRSVINHTLITNNPRMLVSQGGVLNPRELMENRFGGIVNVKSVVDSVAPLPQSSLNPFVFQTIQAMQADKEMLSGISALSQGLDKDAISKQNSGDMVHELISVSQIRQKIIARNFAEGFLRNLYTSVYKLELANRSGTEEVQLGAGNWQPVDFTQWPDDTECEVEFSLGYGEEQKEMQKWISFDQYITNPANGLKDFYPAPKRYAVLQKIGQNMGIRDLSAYLLTPQQLPPPTPDPMQQADLAVKQADSQVKLANAESAKMNVQLAQQQFQQKNQESIAKMTLEREKVLGAQQLATDKLSHEVQIDAVQLQLEQATLEQQKLTGMAKTVL